MGMLVNGQWQQEDLSAFARDGNQVRFDSGFRDEIRADGSTAFLPEAGRYALYCNWTCPWSHRALVTRARIPSEADALGPARAEAELVLAGGKLTLADGDAIVANAQAVAGKLWQRAGREAIG